MIPAHPLLELWPVVLSLQSESQPAVSSSHTGAPHPTLHPSRNSDIPWYESGPAARMTEAHPPLRQSPHLQSHSRWQNIFACWHLIAGIFICRPPPAVTGTCNLWISTGCSIRGKSKCLQNVQVKKSNGPLKGALPSR